MNVQLARDPLKNGHPGGQGHFKKKTKEKEKGKNKTKKTLKKGKKKEAFPYESSIGEIRLMTRPCIRSRHVTVQMSFGQAIQYINIKSCVSLDLNVKKLLVYFGKELCCFK